MDIYKTIEDSGVCCWLGMSPRGMYLTFYNLTPGDMEKIDSLKKAIYGNHDIDSFRKVGLAESRMLLRTLGYLGNINVRYASNRTE